MTLPWDTIASSDAGAFGSPHKKIPAPLSTPKVVIVGAGLAGCWTARLLAERGIPVSIVDRHAQVANGASGNPAGIVAPYVTRSPSLAMSFHELAHRYLLKRLEHLQLTTSSGFQACGVLQLIQRAYPDSTCYRQRDAATAAARAGFPIHCQAIEFAQSGWLNPQALCSTLLEHHLIDTHFDVIVSALGRNMSLSVEAQGASWALNLSDGRVMHADRVILACGEALNLVPAAEHLPLIPARGQISRFALTPATASPHCVINGKHYVIPDGDSVLVGATFKRDSVDSSVTQEDHAQNLSGLQQLLPGLSVKPDAIAGYAGIRATTPDRLPCVGPMPDFNAVARSYADLRHGRTHAHYPALPVIDELYVIAGLGSRGIVTAPLCAHLLVGLLTGTTEKTDESLNPADHIGHWHDWASLINPVRFMIRSLKQGDMHEDKPLPAAASDLAS